MKGQDRPSEGQFGFARGMPDRATDGPPSVRIVHSYDESDQTEQDASGGFHRPRDLASESNLEAVRDRWVVRPKPHGPQPKPDSPFEMRASDIRMSGVSDEKTTGATPSSIADRTPRRWLALALAGMIYFVGLAGLWSMMQSFDNASLLPVTPAGDEQSVPPIEETIDVRDANLDVIIRPKLRPNDLRSPSDVATSGLLDRS